MESYTCPISARPATHCPASTGPAVAGGAYPGILLITNNIRPFVAMNRADQPVLHAPGDARSDATIRRSGPVLGSRTDALRQGSTRRARSFGSAHLARVASYCPQAPESTT